MSLNVPWGSSSVYVMTPDTLGVGGLTTRWPAEILNPLSNGIKYIAFTPGDYSARHDGVRNPGILWPQQGGASSQDPLHIFYAQSVGGNVDVYPWHRSDQAFVPQLYVYNENYIHVYGLWFTGACLLRNTTGSSYNYCRFSSNGSQPLRVRFGANNCLISKCWFQRSVPFDHTGDVVAIQLSDDPCLNITIEDCWILDYSDAIQTTHRETTDYGYAAGLIIRRNFMGYTTAVRDGVRNIEGCENILDFKTGGTQENPVLIEDNQIFGCRPNTRTPGYATTIHICSSDLQFRRNIIYDNEIAFSFHPQYINGINANGWFNPRTLIENNIIQGCRDRGSGLFSGKPGCVWVSQNVATLRNNTIIDCDRLREVAPNINAGTFVLEDNHYIDVDDQNAGTVIQPENIPNQVRVANKIRYDIPTTESPKIKCPSGNDANLTYIQGAYIPALSTCNLSNRIIKKINN